MANMYIADVTVHVDETMSKEIRAKLESDLRSQDGVVSVQASEKAPHLLIVKYDSNHLTSKSILKVVLGDRLHAELVGI